jgi:hypothetical protein
MAKSSGRIINPMGKEIRSVETKKGVLAEVVLRIKDAAAEEFGPGDYVEQVPEFAGYKFLHPGDFAIVIEHDPKGAWADGYPDGIARKEDMVIAFLPRDSASGMTGICIVESWRFKKYGQ